MDSPVLLAPPFCQASALRRHVSAMLVWYVTNRVTYPPTKHSVRGFRRSFVVLHHSPATAHRPIPYSYSAPPMHYRLRPMGRSKTYDTRRLSISPDAPNKECCVRPQANHRNHARRDTPVLYKAHRHARLSAAGHPRCPNRPEQILCRFWTTRGPLFLTGILCFHKILLFMRAVQLLGGWPRSADRAAHRS